MPPEPLLERLPGEQGHFPVRDPRGGDRRPRQGRGVGERVDDRAEPGAPDRLGEGGQPAHRQVGAGPAPGPARVVVGQELGLVGGHVDIGRAVLLAALARQAQVEGVLDLPRAPAVADRAVPVPVEHLEQQPGPPARGVLLLPRHLVRRAHHRAALVGELPAPADADAPVRRLGEGAAVVREAEVHVAPVPRRPVAAQAQVLVQPVRRHDLAGVHPVQRVEEGLQPPERRHQVLAEHPGQQLAPALPVAVLPGERAAELGDQVGRPLHEPPVGGHAVGGVQVERDPGVHAALPEVAVQAGPGVAQVAELLVQAAQSAQVLPEPLGGHGRVLPALEGVGPVRHVRGGAEAGLPHLPQLLLVDGVVEERHVGVVLGLVQRVQHAVGPVVRLLDGVGAELHHQEGPAVGEFAERLGIEVLEPLVVDEPVVDALQGDRLVRQDVRHGLGGLVDPREPQHHQGAFPHDGHEFQLGAQHGDERRLAADQQPGHVEAVFRQQGVEVVAGDPARDAGEAPADLVAVSVPQLPQPPVHGRPQVALPLDPGVLLVAGLAAPEAGAVVEQHLQAGDVVDDLAVCLGGRAAGVVADHAADRAVGVGGGLGAVAQPGGRELPVEFVQDDAGLHHAGVAFGVDGLQPVAVLRPVDHHGRVGALPGQTRPAAPGQHRRPVLPRHGHRLGRRLGRPRQHHADRRPAEVGGVRRVRGPAPGVEPHLAVDPFAQRLRECPRIDGRSAERGTYDGVGQVRRAHEGLLLVTGRAGAGYPRGRSGSPGLSPGGTPRPGRAPARTAPRAGPAP